MWNRSELQGTHQLYNISLKRMIWVRILLALCAHSGKGCGSKGNGQGHGKGKFAFENLLHTIILNFQVLQWTQWLAKCAIIFIVARMVGYVWDFDRGNLSSVRRMRLIFVTRALESVWIFKSEREQVRLIEASDIEYLMPASKGVRLASEFVRLAFKKCNSRFRWF